MTEFGEANGASSYMCGVTRATTCRLHALLCAATSIAFATPNSTWAKLTPTASTACASLAHCTPSSGGAAALATTDNADYTQHRAVRGRYAKFTGSMDVVLLETLRSHNPFTAKHGTRLQMWQRVAALVGETLFQNPDAYSWHTCRDRMTALLKMYTANKRDKLFQHGSADENVRKEALLRELNVSIAHKHNTTIGRQAAAAAASTSTTSCVVADRAVPLGVRTHTPGSNGSNGSNATGPAAAASASAVAPVGKRRRLESPAAAPSLPLAPLPVVAPAAHATVARRVVPHPQRPSASASAPLVSDASDDDDALFRARVLTVLERKVAFDMAQHVKDAALREQELELQKRLVALLQQSQ